jgi:hypothetical protein
MKVSDMDKELLGMHRCIQGRIRWSINARRSSNCIYFKKTKKK